MMLSFEDLLTSFENCQISDAQIDRGTLRLFIDKLSESYRFVDGGEYFLSDYCLHLNKVSYELRLHD